MEYTVLSPWAKAESSKPFGIQPRPASLDGLTIGLYAHFKDGVPEFMQAIGECLQKRYPTMKLSAYQYKKDGTEFCNDPENDALMKAWLKDVDVVIAGLGDAGSCAMFVGYNIAYLEKLGKPTVTMVMPRFRNAFQRGASARAVPAARCVITGGPMAHSPMGVAGSGGIAMHMDAGPGSASKDPVKENYPAAEKVMPEIIEALTKPATEEELTPAVQQDYASATYTGDIMEINRIFYRNGWTNGVPIIPPTEEAVREMLEGTDLPRDYVVAKLPPMLGEATVEKIAVNAVMAGCLPSYMPVLIAAVKGFTDPSIIILEGWTCSVASWMPMTVVTGPVQRQLGINGGTGFLSPYGKASATISRALAYIIMNISGCRQGLEDMSGIGSLQKFGFLFGEDYENSPWTPMHTDYGFSAEDSVVTQFWPAELEKFMGRGVEGALRSMCSVKATGWDCGCAFILSPDVAKSFADAGWTRKMIMDYVVEYNRFIDPVGGTFNNHYPKGSLFPEGGGYSRKTFWNTDHMFVMVAGSGTNLAFTGGGDHGGPARTKIELPKNWDALVEKYRAYVPNYIKY